MRSPGGNGVKGSSLSILPMKEKLPTRLEKEVSQAVSEGQTAGSRLSGKGNIVVNFEG